MDALIYSLKHGVDPMASFYDSLDTSALHFRLAFARARLADPTKPDDEPDIHDYFPATWAYGTYPEGESLAERDPAEEHLRRRQRATARTPLRAADHDHEGRLRRTRPTWTARASWRGMAPDGRPTVQLLQDMYDFAYRYVKFSSSSGLSPRMPKTMADVIGDHDLPRPPGFLERRRWRRSKQPAPDDVLDILLAILAFALWLAQFITWMVTVLPALLADLPTWPRASSSTSCSSSRRGTCYMLSRGPLVMGGFLMPKAVRDLDGSDGPRSERLGPDAPAAGRPRRADRVRGVAADDGAEWPRRVARGDDTGFGLDPAYPRALVTDLDPPFMDSAPLVVRSGAERVRGTVALPRQQHGRACATAGRRRGRTSGRTSRATTRRS